LTGGEKGDSDAPNDSGYSPLHLSVLHGHCAAAKELLFQDANASALPSGGGAAPIHLAAKRGSRELLQLLLIHGTSAHT